MDTKMFMIVKRYINVLCNPSFAPAEHRNCANVSVLFSPPVKFFIAIYSAMWGSVVVSTNVVSVSTQDHSSFMLIAVHLHNGIITVNNISISRATTYVFQHVKFHYTLYLVYMIHQISSATRGSSQF